jgi:aspartyl protease family protein
MRSVMIFAAVAFISAAVGVAVPGLFGGGNLHDQIEAMITAARAAPAAGNTPASAAAQLEASRAAANNRNMTIPRGPNGQFNVEAEIDGRRMQFIVDTGASSIALRESEAARLGIHPARRDYTMRTATANGIIRVAPVELNRVDIGSLTVRNVQAVVIPDEALGQNLLGMTFLSRVRWEHRDGRLLLEQ